MKAATLDKNVKGFVSGISIHAAREGGDFIIGKRNISSARFQSTPPVKAATIIQIGAVLKMIFQSTPPVKAATHTETQYIMTVIIFQSTPPVKAATVIFWLMLIKQVISIHAAREGGDNRHLPITPANKNFNPRRP